MIQTYPSPLRKYLHKLNPNYHSHYSSLSLPRTKVSSIDQFPHKPDFGELQTPAHSIAKYSSVKYTNQGYQHTLETKFRSLRWL